MSAFPAHLSSPVAKAAILYARRGWRVLPVDGKIPFLKNWTELATTNESQIVSWWGQHPNANVGVATGIGSGIFVLDVDPKNGGDDSMEELFSKYGALPDTLQATTGGGGQHYYFKHPNVPVANRGGFLPGLDIKSDGGQVVAAPSVHPGTGHPYTWDGALGHKSPILDAPGWLVEMITSAAGKVFEMPAEIRAGERDQTLYRLACSLRSRDRLSEEGIYAAIAVENRRCSPPLPDEQVRKIAKSAAKYQPGTSRASNGRSIRPVPEERPKGTVAQSSETSGGFLWNDTGNADRLFARHGDDLIYCEERRGLMVFTGSRWSTDDFVSVERLAESTLLAAFADAGAITDGDTRKAYLGFLNRSLQRAGIANMAHSVKRKVRQVSITEFDGCAYLLNCQNGTIDLRTGQLRPHDRRDLITKMIPFDYDAKAECPTFLRFLNRIMGASPDSSEKDMDRADRLVRYVQQALGCAATGKPEKVLFVIYGSGNNGKTTLTEIVREALGNHQYAGEVQVETLMARPKEAAASNSVNADLADLKGCRFVSSSEVEQGQRLSLARVKYLTGLGQLRARYLSQNFFNFQPTHKLFLDCNHKPLINDPNDAVWNRVKLIPFTVTISPEEIDSELPSKLRAELPGILRWIVAGAKTYLQHGLQDIPEVRVATEQYRTESDRLNEFLQDNCIITVGSDRKTWTSVAEMRRGYEAWAEETGDKFPLGKTVFDERLERLGCKKGRDASGSVRVWFGIRFRKPSDASISNPDVLTTSDNDSRGGSAP